MDASIIPVQLAMSSFLPLPSAPALWGGPFERAEAALRARDVSPPRLGLTWLDKLAAMAWVPFERAEPALPARDLSPPRLGLTCGWTADGEATALVDLVRASAESLVGTDRDAVREVGRS
jgi:hypothetical protein